MESRSGKCRLADLPHQLLALSRQVLIVHSALQHATSLQASSLARQLVQCSMSGEHVADSDVTLIRFRPTNLARALRKGPLPP